MTHPSSDEYAAAGGYPIGLVSTLTGLPTDVIRAWERRYGVPRPGRSAGGHRLYSPRDVALLRRAAALRAQGVTAAAACAQALAEATAPARSAHDDGSTSPVAARLAARLHRAAVALDAGQVGATLAEAGALVDLETLWGGVIAPALARLGADWACGAISPAPEHLLSNAVRGRLLTVLEAQPRLPSRPAAVVGAGPGEEHDLAALMLSLLLSRRGWNVTFLGAATPPEAWTQAIEAVRPRVAVASATLAQHAEATLAALREAADRRGQHAPVLAYGGPAFEGTKRDAGEGALTHLQGDVCAAALSLGAYG